MPFQIHSGRVGKRLILVNPVRDDRATVVLEDGSEVTVAPSGTIANGYPGIRAQLGTVPKPIVQAFRQEQRLITKQLRSLQMEAIRRHRNADNAGFEKAIKRTNEQPLLCGGIVIGRELTLVLPKTVFSRNNRFVLPVVAELVVPVSLASR